MRTVLRTRAVSLFKVCKFVVVSLDNRLLVIRGRSDDCYRLRYHGRWPWARR